MQKGILSWSMKVVLHQVCHLREQEGLRIQAGDPAHEDTNTLQVFTFYCNIFHTYVGAHDKPCTDAETQQSILN